MFLALWLLLGASGAHAQEPPTEQIAFEADQDSSGQPIAGVGLLARELRRPRLLMPLYTASIGLNAADVVLTTVASSRGAKEANALLGWASEPWRMAAVKAGTAAVTILLTEGQWRAGHRRRAVITMAAVVALNAAVVAHNARALARLP
jgi:hypothetical protein